MNREQVIATLRAHEPDLRRRGVLHAALFGSVARNEAKPSSDIDILIEIEPGAPVGVFEYVGITQYLADLFPNRVDVANRKGLKALVRPSAERDAIYASKSSNRTRLALFDIRDNVLFARKFVGGLTKDEFVSDRQTFHGVTRCLEIISEASRRLSPALRARHPELPWRSIMGAGKVYRHDHDNVVEELVWQTAQQSLAPLMAVIEAEIARLPDSHWVPLPNGT